MKSTEPEVSRRWRLKVFRLNRWFWTMFFILGTRESMIEVSDQGSGWFGKVEGSYPRPRFRNNSWCRMNQKVCPYDKLIRKASRIDWEWLIEGWRQSSEVIQGKRFDDRVMKQWPGSQVGMSSMDEGQVIGVQGKCWEAEYSYFRRCRAVDC